ncbi:aldo/keto reductase [Sporolactobacillus vineae]|uniref:aldo/keto reductase n=1 Tax=Sporolactobacillus vineae TaxID=444463 RepID=UPI0018726A8C
MFFLLQIEDQKIEKIRRAVLSRKVKFADGTEVPAIGQGTWHMGDDPENHQDEVDTLRLGIRLGMTLIDTAELYGYGKSERVVGEAIRGLRDQIFLVSKVMPSHAGGRNLVSACESSLKRLGTDHLDLYLLHWKGGVPIEQTIDGMEKLKQSGKILRWGVSNFDTADMKNLIHRPDGAHCTTNQVLYHLGSRGIEVDLLPWQKAQHMPVMAYSPIAQGGSLKKQLTTEPALKKIAAAHDVSPIQLLLAWCIRRAETDGVIAIPKASRPEHVLANAEAASVHLSAEELQTLDRLFPRPSHKVPLDLL